jgi:hypothetical protein
MGNNYQFVVLAAWIYVVYFSIGTVAGLVVIAKHWNKQINFSLAVILIFVVFNTINIFDFINAVFFGNQLSSASSPVIFFSIMIIGFTLPGLSIGFDELNKMFTNFFSCFRLPISSGQ